jgi:hypothetical protein
LSAFDGAAGGQIRSLPRPWLSFVFVFVHPFEDGNGRIHRHLIHHMLAMRGFSPIGVVFPVSAAILDRSAVRGRAVPAHRYGRRTAPQHGLHTAWCYRSRRGAQPKVSKTTTSRRTAKAKPELRPMPPMSEAEIMAAARSDPDAQRSFQPDRSVSQLQLLILGQGSPSEPGGCTGLDAEG